MTAIVILAAGSSSRMGTAKQNLVYKGKTLIETIVAGAQSVVSNVVVVLGASKDKIAPNISNKEITILDNVNWEKGIATSITLAVEHLVKMDDQPDAIIFVLCDQPHVNAELLSELIKTSGTAEHGIIACNYSDTVGVPALFKKRYFPDLLRLTGKEGAKKLFDNYANDVQTVPFPLGSVDIDTEDDFKKLL